MATGLEHLTKEQLKALYWDFVKYTKEGRKRRLKIDVVDYYKKNKYKYEDIK